MQIIFTGQHTFHKVLLQSTQDNSNLQGKLKTFRVIESSSSSGVENKMTGYKEKMMFNVILIHAVYILINSITEYRSRVKIKQYI